MDPTMARYYAVASAIHQFERPARDLVDWLKISNGQRVLDVGSGSGMVAFAACHAVGSSGFVVALDSSMEMLRQQQANDRLGKIVAVSPDLPFQDHSFDCAVAGFVISHIPDYAAALAETIRVLRPAGIFGATAWESGTPQVSEVWKSTIERFVNLKLVQDEFARIIPWDEFFSDPGHLSESFRMAGFVDVETATKDYLISMNSHQYISTKIGSIEGTIIRDRLQREGWKTFLNELLVSLQQQFPDGIEYTRNVHFVSGRKPIAA